MAEPSQFGLLIRALRDKQNLTRDQLAEMTGVHSNTIYQLESGQRGRNPRRAIVLALAQGLGVHPAELLEKAGLFQKGDDVPVLDRITAFETFVRGDPLLRADQKDALIASYRSMVPFARRAAGSKK